MELDRTQKELAQDLVTLGFCYLKNHKTILTYPEYPLACKDFKPEPAYIMHRAGLVLSVAKSAGINDFSSDGKMRVWISESTRTIVKLVGDNCRDNWRVVVHFLGR